MYAYTVYGASLTPAVLAIFFWKRVNKYGGLASMLAGIITTLLWEIPLSKPFGINSVIVALPLAIIALYFGTVLTENKVKNQEELSINK
jgi:Na+/proline symporter